MLRLLDKETVARNEVLEIFASVQKRPVRGSYTGYGKRLPSDRPPVLSPKELALAAADGYSNERAARRAQAITGPGYTPRPRTTTTDTASATPAGTPTGPHTSSPTGSRM